MRILIVTQYFWPENFRINDLCTELVKRGHDIVVLTGKPNYPDGRVFPEFKSSPGAFSEYNGCSVIRVPIVPRGQGSSVQLLLNYISYVFSAGLLGPWKLRKQSYDVIFVYEPSPVTVCLPAIFMKKLRRVPVIFWVLDIWPETLEAVGVVRSPKLLDLVGRLVHYIYNRCDMILGQSKAFYGSIARYCNDTSKIRYFPSWSESIFQTGAVPGTVEEVVRHEKAFKILFAGNIGEAQDFPAVLAAARLLKSRGFPAKLFVVGDGRAFESVKEVIRKEGLEEYVILLGRHPLELMPDFYASADALLVTLKESKSFERTIPAKVQSYMAAGKPILTMLSGEGSRVVDEAACGLTAMSGDADKLVENIIEMASYSGERLHALGQNAKAYSDREFNRDRLIDQLLAWFEEAASKGRAVS